ncbi:hypothetical protein OQA88_4540 [Cercophora sp. LCS_1]
MAWYTKGHHMGSTAATGLVTEPTAIDPYRYMHGFGNHHATEAIPGALPDSGTNIPLKHKYGLYSEHINGTSFISSRETVSNVWLYRERPGAPHRPLRPIHEPHDLEACFLPTNTNINFTPLTHTWGPLPQNTHPSATEPTTFIQGLKTIAGTGDATLREGLAVHQYAFNASMHNSAFSNHDGDLLLVPHTGTLDIKTEMGTLRLPPGHIAVLPSGIRFSVTLPYSCPLATGYALELFGTHFRLPDLGPLGANALAHPRDFVYPVASFDLSPPDAPQWEITLKLAGKLYKYTQPHTPFDVVAWHGNLAPYRYDLAKFHYLSPNKDQLDPTAYCVLTAPGKYPGVSVVDFCVFGEKWAVNEDTLRIPYYHRTMATEMCGVIRGEYKGSVRDLEGGGLSFEGSWMPHGETYDAVRGEMRKKHEAGKVGKGFLGFMFHISANVALTRWAMERHPDIRPERPGLWDNFKGHLLDHLDEVNASLSRLGRATMHPQPFTPPASPLGTIVPEEDAMPVPGDDVSVGDE